MMRRLRSESGVTLVELMVAIVLMSIVLTATMTAFNGLQKQHQLTERHTESLAKARQTMQRLARQLRNLASPTTLTASAALPHAIDRAGPYDLIFRTVDDKLPSGSSNATNVMRMRYCLSENPGNKRRWRVWVQTQRWTTATYPPMETSLTCPAPGWDTQSIFATEIVNATNGATPIPAFTYNSTNLAEITKIRSELLVDNDPDAKPSASRLVSSVILRNQNQRPAAAFTVTVLDNNRNLRLDASSSSDPEGQALRYCWFTNHSGVLPACSSTPKPSSYIGEGVVLAYQAPTAGVRTFHLRVEDPAGLSAQASQTGSY